MQDLYGQYGRGPTLIERKRGFGLPVVMASGATAIALAGFFVVAALGRNEPAEPLPPRSTPLEAVKAPTESVTGSLMKVTELTPAAERRAPPPVSAPAPAPPQPAPAPAPTPLIEAQPPAPPAPAPTVVASAEISTTLPSPIPPLTAPPTAPPLATPQAPAPAPVVNTPPPAPPKPRTGPSQAEVTAFTNRANDLIKSGDVAGARLLLERAASGEDGASLLALAETYDPAVLNRWGVIGVRPDVEKARRLYQKAADHGVAAAKERMLALR